MITVFEAVKTARKWASNGRSDPYDDEAEVRLEGGFYHIWLKLENSEEHVLVDAETGGVRNDIRF
jgi:hypothetical protein